MATVVALVAVGVVAWVAGLVVLGVVAARVVAAGLEVPAPQAAARTQPTATQNVSHARGRAIGEECHGRERGPAAGAVRICTPPSTPDGVASRPGAEWEQR